MFLQLLIGSLVIGGIYGLMGLGYSLIYRASGLMTFTQGEFMMLGSYLGLIFFRDSHWPYFLALYATLMVLFSVGFALEKFLIRPILSRNGKVIHVILGTMGVAIVIPNLIIAFYPTDVQMFPSIFKTKLIQVGPLQVAPESILSIIVAFVFMIALHLFMNHTRLGTAMRAAAQDGMAASVCGISVTFTKGLTWAIAAALAAVAGVLIGPVYGVHMGIGAMPGLKGFAAAVIGGFGNMYGSIIGGLLVGFLETFAAGYISSMVKDFVAFLVLILFLIFKPSGIFNAKIIEV